MLSCTIGIMAYNEEQNIGQLLDALLRQKLATVTIDGITVVASGCTDRTVPTVERYVGRYPNVCLIVQAERRGKSSAINLFLKTVKTPFVVLQSADTLPLIGTIEKLVAPLQDERTGMCGSRPMPQNNPATFMGFTNHLLWTLHHLLSLQRPKMGELIAFRNVVPSIPESSAVDETSIEAFVSKRGLTVRYVPEAIVVNRGAETVRDFLKQRRRIYAGHSIVRRQEHYSVATLNAFKIFWLILRYIQLTPKTTVWLFAAIALEGYGRFLGLYDSFIKKDSHTVWAIATTTKKIIE